jgi:RNA polymerase sporulation-specific sigma factor
MAGNKVELCGVNTAKLPLLKEEEKEELLARIKEGDEDAREQYIKGNLRLVLSVIKRFSSSSENADDLFQIGCVGLMKAVDHFDPSRLVKFSTYAVPMIIGEIRRYLRDNNSIRVSRSLRDTAYKAIYAKEGFVKKYSKEPTMQEIAEEIGISKEAANPLANEVPTNKEPIKPGPRVNATALNSDLSMPARLMASATTGMIFC